MKVITILLVVSAGILEARGQRLPRDISETLVFPGDSETNQRVSSVLDEQFGQAYSLGSNYPNTQSNSEASSLSSSNQADILQHQNGYYYPKPQIPNYPFPTPQLPVYPQYPQYPQRPVYPNYPINPSYPNSWNNNYPQIPYQHSGSSSSSSSSSGGSSSFSSSSSSFHGGQIGGGGYFYPRPRPDEVTPEFETPSFGTPYRTDARFGGSEDGNNENDPVEHPEGETVAVENI